MALTLINKLYGIERDMERRAMPSDTRRASRKPGFPGATES
jgi:hypothetical protein